jgi:hypothetical protein
VLLYCITYAEVKKKMLTTANSIIINDFNNIRFQTTRSAWLWRFFCQFSSVLFIFLKVCFDKIKTTWGKDKESLHVVSHALICLRTSRLLPTYIKDADKPRAFPIPGGRDQ